MNLREYPVLERITRPDGVRHYIDPTGAPLASVTTILDGTADKTFLKEWQDRVGEKAANKARNDGTALGTLVHTHLEKYLLDQPRPTGNNLIRQMASRMADQIINRGLPKVNEIWGVESMLYFPGLYAGTTDLVGIYEGKPAIMDFKNAKKMRKRDQIDDYMDQMCAYALAHNELFGTDIRTGVIFMVARDLQFEIYTVEGKEFDKHVDSFLNRVESYLGQSKASASASASA
jgi:CRISPR/Cas system-associated exonuclease Cas4 (RecB family)